MQGMQLRMQWPAWEMRVIQAQVLHLGDHTSLKYFFISSHCSDFLYFSDMKKLVALEPSFHIHQQDKGCQHVFTCMRKLHYQSVFYFLIHNNNCLLSLQRMICLRHGDIVIQSEQQDVRMKTLSYCSNSFFILTAPLAAGWSLLLISSISPSPAKTVRGPRYPCYISHACI